jgi:predicted Zn-dependent peptidase
LIEQYFGSRVDQAKLDENFSVASFGSTKKTERIAIEKKATDQAQLMLGFPAFPYNHPSNPAVAVLNTVLGGSMSSRLFIEIREKRGLAYMVKSGAEPFRDTGFFYVRAGLESKNINKAIKVMQNEMQKIIDKGVTVRELKDAKTNIRGSLVLSLEDSSAEANWYAAEALFAKKIKTPEEKLSEIDGVSNEQIKDVAKKIFKMEEMRVAVIGNLTEESIKF